MITCSPEFKQFLDRCSDKSNAAVLAEDLYIGRGNTASPVLFVGQEPSGEDGISRLSFWRHKSERKNSDKNNAESLPAQHMWRNYQRLYECIKNSGSYNPHPEKIDFEEYIFTTEMSGMVSTRNVAARKLPGHAEQLQWRKDYFFTDEFFKSFPVIVLACGNYLRNDGYKDKWEINRIFDVSFDDDGGLHEFLPCNNFYCHHSSDGTRLVIHTRNLSSGVNGKMLVEMGRVIRKHLEYLGLISFFK